MVPPIHLRDVQLSCVPQCPPHPAKGCMMCVWACDIGLLLIWHRDTAMRKVCTGEVEL